MAGNLAMTSAENADTTLLAIKYQWEIEYARFFNLPKNPTATSPHLKPIARSRALSRGTWLSSSSTASVRLITVASNPETIVLVVLREKIVEEHFTCNLHFSWPQVSCVTQCPPRGSRAIFASYRDCAGQIEKFALRFVTSSDAETFMDAMRGCMNYAKEIGIPRSDLTEISSQSEFVSSNRLQYSAEELGFVDNVATNIPHAAPVLNDNCMPNACPQESSRGHSFECIYGDLPPSFTELLMNSSAEAAEQGPKLSEEADLKSQIMRYMSDSSFHDILTKVEQVIGEMGGNLSL